MQQILHTTLPCGGRIFVWLGYEGRIVWIGCHKVCLQCQGTGSQLISVMGLSIGEASLMVAFPRLFVISTKKYSSILEVSGLGLSGVAWSLSPFEQAPNSGLTYFEDRLFLMSVPQGVFFVCAVGLGVVVAFVLKVKVRKKSCRTLSLPGQVQWQCSRMTSLLCCRSSTRGVSLSKGRRGLLMI